jgi:rhomboid protease GluP
VTIALASVSVAVFAGMLFGTGSRSDPATLLAWGAGFGPRTTNGEWWRLASAPFVHPSLFVLLVNTVVLVQASSILERLAGRFVVSAVYAAAAILGSATSLATFPMRVIGGASAAVAGILGTFAIVVAVGRWRRSAVSVPNVVLKRMAPGILLFVVCCVAADNGVGAFASAVGALAGVMFGVVVVAQAHGDGAPAWRPTAAAFGTAMTAAALAAVPMRGIADVRPEIGRVVAVERRTAGVYRTAQELFARGKMTPWQLADVVEQSIVPQVQAAEVHMIALRGVPREDEHFVSDAREYFRLRIESWQLRVNGLRAQSAPADPSAMERGSKLSFRAWAEARYQATLRTMSKAEVAERASLQAFNRLTP